MKRLAAFILMSIVVLAFIQSCELNPGSGNVVITNTIITGTHTNWTVVTNDVTIMSNGFLVTGTIILSNHYNEQRLQPTYLLSGTLTGDIVDYIADGTNSLMLYITNSGYSNYGSVEDGGSYKSWSLVVYQQTNSYIFKIL